MEQRSLKVVETNKTFFSKITNTLTKILIPTRVGINNVMITIKRNALLKAYKEYKQTEGNTEAKKYEDAYALYLEAIDKYIMDSIYKKVKNNTATTFEREYLSKYYLIVSLKEKHYLEYKYKKQEYLLKIDYETAKFIKKESLLKKYKEFYIEKMDSIYKGILKNYSVNIADNINNSTDSYNKIFSTLEDYVINILPIKLDKQKDHSLNKDKDYEKYENSIIGKLDKKDIIFKKAYLLNISRNVFTHSLPLSATEKCYLELIKEMREIIQKSENDIKRENAYKAFFKLMEEYNTNVLSTKVYWTNPKERDEYKRFWYKYSNTNSSKEKEILILKYDLKRLNSKRDKKIRMLHKEKLVKVGEMKQLNSMPRSNIKRYTTKKKETV